MGLKSWIGRAGKVASAIQKEGLAAGSAKTWRYTKTFLAALLEPKTGDILIVTSGVGDSARYRATHHAEELNLHGLRTAVVMADDPRLFGYADTFKVVIFQKVPVSAKVKKFFELLKEKNREVLFETDDLVFDPQYFSAIDYLKNINLLERQLYQNGLGAEILNDSYVTHCTTTTTFLAGKIREKGKQVFVVPNKLSQEDLVNAKKIHDTRYVIHDTVRIGYFSGSAGHNKDFATAASAIVEIMRRHESVELVIAGLLELPREFEVLNDRVRRLPFADREKHFENISSVDINIVPLEIGNPFCESKSELKFFEAGIVGVPTVAAGVQTFREAITDGADGFIADNITEWTEKLERLVNNPELRKTIGEKARETALEKYTTGSKGNEEYYEYLRSGVLVDKK